MGHRAAVVGCGAQGRVISAFFARDPDFDEIALFDIKPESCTTHAQSLRGEHQEKVFRVGRVDAADSGEVGRAAKGCDILVNAVIPKYNLSLMKAALLAGANYLDMAFGPPYSNLEAQLALAQAFRDAGLTALIGAGKSPGLTNLLVAEASDMLEKVFNVRIRLYGEIKASEPVITWSPKTFLEDCALPPSHIVEGRLVHSPPFSGEEEYAFPKVGVRRVWLHEHEESYMFYRTFVPKGLRNFDLKMAGLEGVRALYELGLLKVEDAESSERIELLASLLPQPPSQRELLDKIARGVIKGSVGLTVVEVEGLLKGFDAKITMWVEDPNIVEVVKTYPMATDDSYVVGASCYLFAKTLLHSKISAGALTPEELPKSVRREVLRLLGAQSPPIRVEGRLEENVAALGEALGS